MDADRPESTTGTWPVIWLILFFLGFPAILVDVALQQVLRFQKKTLERQTFFQLDETLRRYEPFGNPETFFPKALHGLFNRADRAKKPLETAQRIAKALEEKNPGLFTFTFFDHQDRIVQEPNANHPRRIPELFLSLMRQGFVGRQTKHAIFDPYLNIIRTYLGQITYSLYFDKGPRWVLTSYQAKKSWFFFHIGRSFSVFANLHREGYQPMMAIRRLIKKERDQGIRLNLIDMANMTITGPGGGPWQSDLRFLAAQLDREPGNHFPVKDRLCSLLTLDSQFQLVASLPDDTSDMTQSIQGKFRLGALSLIFLVIGLFSLWRLGAKKTFFSIRWQLVGLFLYVTGLPLAIFAFLGGIHLKERERGLLQESVEQARERLWDFDAKLTNVNRICQAKLNRIISRCSLEKPGGFASFTMEIQRFKKDFECSQLVMIDLQGREIKLRQNAPPPSIGEKIMKGLMHEVICQAAGQPKTTTSPDLVKGEMLLEALAGEKDGVPPLVNHLLGHLGKIIPKTLGNEGGYTYWKLIHNSTGKPTHIMVLNWKSDDFIHLYLKRMISPTPLKDGSELLAWDMRANYQHVIAGPPGQQKLFAPAYNWHFPQKPLTRPIRRFIQSVIRIKRFDSTQLPYKRGAHLICGLPGFHLQPFLLLSFRPLNFIQEEIQKTRLQLGLFAVLSVLFTSLAGLVLANRFLNPIADLSQGMAAVQRKDFDAQIPCREGDEFGDLASHFNQMMESLKEVDIGREVQSRLFPKSELVIGEYRVFGLSRPASQMGGDYFDYFPLSANSFLVMVGDVTGHGIGAALVMGMAKAVISGLSDLHVPPAIILKTLNSVLFRNLRNERRILAMTLFAGWFDLSSNRVMLFNCGHPFSFRQKTDGSMHMIQHSGFPIGSFSTFRNIPLDITLEPGEKLICYTDGLVESMVDSAFTQNGFELFRLFLESFTPSTGKELCEKVMSEHPALKGGKPLSDDCTIVVIERL